MKEISKERLEKKIDFFEDKGWKSHISSEFPSAIVFSPLKAFYSEEIITKQKKEYCKLTLEARDASRYINLRLIHYAKYPEEYKILE